MIKQGHSQRWLPHMLLGAGSNPGIEGSLISLARRDNLARRAIKDSRANAFIGSEIRDNILDLSQLINM